MIVYLSKGYQITSVIVTKHNFLYAINSLTPAEK